MVAFGEYSDDGTASAMKARDYKDATDLVASVCSGHGYWMDAEGKAATLRSQDSITKADTLISQPTCITGDTTHTLKAEGFDAFEDGTGRGQPIINHRMAVRRLTPVECERLQGFPDNYTDIRPKGKSTPDGPRYKALGNSMAVPVMAWIGKRIQAVEQITNP
jgi:DNA (cytosine-5)-methyltransferase 1